MVEKIFEALKSAKPEEWAEAVDQAQKQVADLLLQEKAQSHITARVQLYDTIKNQIAQQMPELFSGIDISRVKYEDMLAKIAQHLKDRAAEPKQAERVEPAETIEQVKARLESEYAKKLEEERTKLAHERAYAEVEAAAIARRLDPHYKRIFAQAVRAEIEPELVQDQVVFKDRTTNKYYTRDGQYATAEQVAEDLLRKYPKFMAELPKTPSLTAAPSELAGNRLRAGLAELTIFKQV